MQTFSKISDDSREQNGWLALRMYGILDEHLAYI